MDYFNCTDGTTVVDSVFVRPCLVNQSRGRKIDGTNDWGVFTNPSPNNVNSNALNGYVDKPQFSMNQVYDNPITLEISCSNPNIQYSLYFKWRTQINWQMSILNLFS